MARRHTALPSCLAPRHQPLVLHPPRLRELAHHALLFFGELFWNGDRDLDDEVAALSVLLDALAADAEALARRRAGRNADRHLLVSERADADPRAERRLRDVDGHRRQHVQPFALEEAVRLHLERDDDVARRPAVHALPALALEADARARVGAGRHGDQHALPAAHLARPPARRAALRRHMTPAQTHGARAVDGEAALAERDHAAPRALGTRTRRRAGRAAGAV